MEAGGNSRRMDLQAMTTTPLASVPGRPGESEHQGQPGAMTKVSPKRILTAASSSGSGKQRMSDLVVFQVMIKIRKHH